MASWNSADHEYAGLCPWTCSTQLQRKDRKRFPSFLGIYANSQLFHTSDRIILTLATAIFIYNSLFISEGVRKQEALKYGENDYRNT
jgi:hypothetical protein